MDNKKICVLIVLGLIVVVHSAPQFQSQSQFQSNQQSNFQSFNQLKSQTPVQYNQAQVQTAAEPQHQSKYIVTEERFHQDPNLEYNFEQKFANGEEFKEDGKLRNVNGMDVIVTRGSYTLMNPDGSTVLVNYYADETGFHPEIVTSAPAPSFDVRAANYRN